MLAKVVNNMDIKLLKQGWMTTSGSSLLTMMQNVSMPVLDLIVRESLQNSLDAAIKNQINSNVLVRFDYVDFDKDKLASELDGITNQVRKLNTENGYKALVISDRHTVGLTGNLNGIIGNDPRGQHLGKLVFQIMKPQENEGAGGSWGIGKTVYYRLGVGLILYYSRIKTPNGNFQNRLVGALVEDEHKPGLLSSFGEDNLGAAFFGEKVNDDYVGLQAITNDEYISKILNIFNLEPYTGTDTGTSIIIPFINEKKALSNNALEEEKPAWWDNDIPSYLKMSILRWYAPRTSTKYPYGPKLIAQIGDDIVSFDSDTKLLQELKKLYEYAFSEDEIEGVKRIPIERQRNVQDNTLGWFVYEKINIKEFFNGHNHPSIYKYFGIDYQEHDYNVPIVCFCRKPGMVLNYKTDWKVKIDKEEMMLGIFVLNSDNQITSPIQLNLDEYMRKSEKSDHVQWTDYSINDNSSQIRIVGHIMNRIESILDSEFGDKNIVSGQGELNTVLAYKYGRMLLPDEGFGSAVNRTSKSSGSGGSGRKRSGGSVVKAKTHSISLLGKKYSNNFLDLTYSIDVSNKVHSMEISNAINTVIGKICTPDKWEENSINYPISIHAAVKVEKRDNVAVNDAPFIMEESSKTLSYFDVSYLNSTRGVRYGLLFDFKTNKFNRLTLKLHLRIASEDKTLSSSFSFKFNEG